MNKSVIGILITVALVGGGVGAYMLTRDDSSEKSSTNASTSADVMEKKDTANTESTTMAKEEDAMMKKDEAAMEKTDEAMEQSDDAMMKKSETYITLADYEGDKTAYQDQTKVLFFHASWCPICKAIDKDITADPSQIPSDATFIKTDFDSSTELRQKYGVTTQYTFVQIDNDGNEIAQWSATDLDKAIAGIN